MTGNRKLMPHSHTPAIHQTDSQIQLFDTTRVKCLDLG
jgi:hypothetical protein